MANATTVINYAVDTARATGNFNMGEIARLILTYKEPGKKGPSYKGVGKKYIDQKIIELVATNPDWVHLQNALKVLDDRQKAERAVAKAQVVPQAAPQVTTQTPMSDILGSVAPQVVPQAAPQVVPQATPQVVPQVVPQATFQAAPQVVPQTVVKQNPTVMSQVLAQSQFVPQAQNKGPREIKHGQVLQTYGDLRLVSGTSRQGTRTFWVADNYGKSVASLGKLELVKQAVAILEAVKAQLAKQ